MKKRTEKRMNNALLRLPNETPGVEESPLLPRNLGGLGYDFGDIANYGDFFDDGASYADIAYEAIPASQLDWSGDYGFGDITNSVYGDTGGVLTWDWDASGAGSTFTEVINAALPPADPIAAGLDISKLIQTATGVYQYVKQASGKYVAQKVQTAQQAPFSPNGVGKMLPLLALGALAFVALK